MTLHDVKMFDEPPGVGEQADMGGGMGNEDETNLESSNVNDGILDDSGCIVDVVKMGEVECMQGVCM